MKKRLIVVLAVLATVVGMAFAGTASSYKLKSYGEIADTTEQEYTVEVEGYSKENLDGRYHKAMTLKICAPSGLDAEKRAIEKFKIKFPDYKYGINATACSSDSCTVKIQ
jgi:hypothetical protein